MFCTAIGVQAFLAMALSASSRSTGKKSTKSPTKPGTSPNRKNRHELHIINKNTPRQGTTPNWTSEATKGTVVLYGCNKGNDQDTDAFVNPLLTAVGDGEFLEEHGVITHSFRHDLSTGGAVRNASNGFFRVWIVQIDPDTTPERRQNLRQIFADYMTQHNRFDTTYTSGRDLTPANRDDWKRVDRELLNNDVYAIIDSIFNNVDSDWYANNPEDADDFFTPPYCGLAKTALGYPDNDNV